MLNRVELVENFAVLLEKERIHRKLTQQQMADRMGMGISTYKKLMNGETGRIDLYNAYTLFRFNESSILQLFGYPAELYDVAAKLSELSPLKLAIIKLIAGIQNPEAYSREQK